MQSTEALVNSAAGYKLLPKYHQLNKAKKTLIPAFNVTEDGKDAIVPLQDLLNMDVAQILGDPEVKAAVSNLLDQVPHIEIRDHFKIGLDHVVEFKRFLRATSFSEVDDPVTE